MSCIRIFFPHLPKILSIDGCLSFFLPGHGANSSMQPASPSPDLVRTASTRQDMERPDLARPVSPYERKNSIPIRLCRTSDPAQPLPICPARAMPIPKVLKALQKARDQSRQRRQVLVGHNNKVVYRGKNSFANVFTFFHCLTFLDCVCAMGM